MSNRLASETSPYLREHAENPVDWYPWGEAAFEKAQREDKPVFLSIGYSTCHWCHVMAAESFENARVAEVLNKYYVAVKVDREERPDIDSVYMSVCTALTGSGGWPLNVIMTPEQQPFFAAFDGENAVGFLYLAETGRDTAELYVMGVLKEYHRRGVGKMLFAAAKQRAKELGYSFLQVKTVQMGKYPEYDATNRFYLALGFGEFEVFPTLWDEWNPCQIYVMSLK